MYPPIETLVPHEPPLVLLDEVIEADERGISTRVCIREDSMFIREGRVRGIVGLEYMAQSIAAFAGLQRHQGGEPPKLGYVIGVPKLELATDFFEVGDELTVKVQHLWGDGDLGRFECQIIRGENEVAQATMSVYGGDEIR